MRLFNQQLIEPVLAFIGADTAGPPPQQAGPKPTPADASQARAETVWDGVERRSGEDRRQAQRRHDKVDTPLDTRASQDRRQHGRRATDHVTSISLKV
ncbi:hypothetical protein GCM10007860_00220 [Chitiniphilus shinanonensis]|uniref:Uncharacterized protein n=1 Tax=Chitiniphilus shinanonensis TaxID=553088 RepID=A0ABQ6BMK3_9NEIS|nr:hypothetical protein [Chitiniphilus shinanonensis]GLS02879.1 hypothetical protein GCM10007860_00220 [Chitiniphilus shinanonensis]